MPILSADALEQVVINAVFSDVAQQDGERLQDEIATAIERHRAALLEALRQSYRSRSVEKAGAACAATLAHSTGLHGATAVAQPVPAWGAEWFGHALAPL